MLQYLFQIRLAASWLPAAGCDAPAPPHGCDALWAGLRRVTSVCTIRARVQAW